MVFGIHTVLDTGSVILPAKFDALFDLLQLKLMLFSGQFLIYSDRCVFSWVYRSQNIADLVFGSSSHSRLFDQLIISWVKKFIPIQTNLCHFLLGFSLHLCHTYHDICFSMTSFDF